MKKLIVSLFFISILLVSCTSKTSVVTGPVNILAGKLAQGKTIFENSCGRCHDVPEPIV